MLKLGKKKKGDAAAVEGDANLPAVSEGEATAEGEEAPKKKKLPLLFIIIPVALLVLGGGGAGAFFLLKPKPAVAAEGEHGAAPAKPEKKEGGHGGGHGEGGEGAEADPSLGVISDGPDGVTFLTLPDLVVNVQAADGKPTFLKLKLTLEMKDAATATELQEQMPRLQDMFQGFLRELRPEEMSGSAGTYQLRAEILRRVNLIAAPSKIDAVLIEEMLVQ